MAEDKFDTFEKKVYHIAGTHKHLIMVLLGAGLILFVVSVFILQVGAASGFAYYEQTIRERHDNSALTPSDSDYVPEDTITNWDSITVPFITFLFSFLDDIVIFFVALYILAAIYFIVRWIYRKRKIKPICAGISPEE